MAACHQSQCRQNFNAPLVNTAAMVLRYLPEVQQHLAPPFPVWKYMWRNPYRKKKRQKKSIFIYGATFKKNESGRDFQRGQIWNNRSQKQKKENKIAKSAPPRHLNIHVPLPQNVLLFYAPSFFLLYYSPILAVNLT